MGRHVSTHDGCGKMWGGGKSREQLADRAAVAVASSFPKRDHTSPTRPWLHGSDCLLPWLWNYCGDIMITIPGMEYAH